MDQPDASTGAKILPGMAGRVSGTARLSEEAEASGFVIPESAIFQSDSGEKHVWFDRRERNDRASQLAGHAG